MSEYACKCGCSCKDVNPPIKALRAKIESALGVKLHINSAKRCERHNRAVGGAKNSQHVLGNALDITSPNHTAKQLHAELTRLHKSGVVNIGGMGLYKSFVHIDTRAALARWQG